MAVTIATNLHALFVCVVSVEGILQACHHNSKLSVYVYMYVCEELAWRLILQRPEINLIRMFCMQANTINVKIASRPLE